MNDIGKQISSFFIGFILVVIVIAIFGTIYTIDAGERGVLLTFGKADVDAKGQGIHFKYPLAQKVIKMEVRTQKIETLADSASKDLQDVQTNIALNYHLDPDKVSLIYSELGKEYRERIIDPAIQEIVKSVSANFKAEELITDRTVVRTNMKDMLKERLNKYYIIVDDFNIVNFQFSEEFDRAIESKVTAEQLKLKAERDLERIIIEKEQKIAEAQAEAESLRLQKLEVTDNLIKLREIEMQREAIAKWNGALPTYTGGSAIPFINIGSQ